MLPRLIALLVLSGVFAVDVPTTRLLFNRKFTDGYFEGQVAKLLLASVRDHIHCAFLCMTARPRCQSFNLRCSNEEGGNSGLETSASNSIVCETSEEVPHSLDQNSHNYTYEEGASYYEMVYDPETKILNCTDEDVCPRDTGMCWKSVQRKDGGLLRVTYCLEGHQETTTWDEARSACNENGGQLVEDRSENFRQIISAFAQDFVLLQNNRVWIGGQGNYLGEGDKGSNKLWVWQDDTQISKFSWVVSDPNEPDDRDCLSIIYLAVTNEYLWVDRNCTTYNPFVCEYSYSERV